MNLKALVDYLSELFLSYLEAYFKIELLIGICSVHKSEILRNVLVKYDTTYCRIDDPCFGVISADIFCYSHLDSGVDRDISFIVSHNSFIEVAEHLSFTLFAGLIDRKIIRTEYHILGRNCNGATVRGL